MMTDYQKELFQKIINGTITKDKTGVFVHKCYWDGRELGVKILPTYADYKDYVEAWEMYQSLPLIKALE